VETDLLTLAIGSLSFLKPREKFSLAAAVRDEKDFLSLTLFDVEMTARRALRVRDFSPETVLSKVERIKAYLDRKGIWAVSLLDEGYPALLKEIYDPPFLLFCRGERSSLGENLLAVVGTRQPTGRGLDAAYSLGFDAGSSGLGIVSGLARGIDAAAHRGNLEGGGRTVAVLGCGIDRIYPSQTAIWEDTYSRPGVQL
jgi:DNA processing protein